MERLKVCFVGVGSIARRHIRNLREVCVYRSINLIIDALRRENIPVEGVDNVYSDIRKLPDDYDVLFITNPTETHLNSLIKLHNKGRHFFIEKPVVTPGQIKEATRLELKKNSVYYVACPLRHNGVIQWIKKNVSTEDVIGVRSISSSYLPEWRPEQDYRGTYSSHRDLGGGVSTDLIHEWDYLTYLFGWPKEIHSLIGKKSDLEIDSDDYALYIANYDSMTVELHLDYYGRKPIRQIQLFTKEETIIGDLTDNTITKLVSGERIDLGGERDDYQKKELTLFLDMIDDRVDSKEKLQYGFEHGLKMLELTQGVLS